MGSLSVRPNVLVDTKYSVLGVDQEQEVMLDGEDDDEEISWIALRGSGDRG